MFEVLHINWPSVIAFLTVETQWRAQVLMNGAIHWFGLDYAACAAALRGRSDKAWQALLADLRVMEAEALPILNEGDAP